MNVGMTITIDVNLAVKVDLIIQDPTNDIKSRSDFMERAIEKQLKSMGM